MLGAGDEQLNATRWSSTSPCTHCEGQRLGEQSRGSMHQGPAEAARPFYDLSENASATAYEVLTPLWLEKSFPQTFSGLQIATMQTDELLVLATISHNGSRTVSRNATIPPIMCPW